MRKRQAAFLRIIAAKSLALYFFTHSAYSQGSIDNTLGSGGSFRVKNSTTTFLSIDDADGKITVPTSTSAGLGVIYKGSNRFLHDYKPAVADGGNIFIGSDAGNFTMSASISSHASRNTGVGFIALTALTNGYQNSALGHSALSANTTGSNNNAFGYRALGVNTTGSNNNAFGAHTLYLNTSGYMNVAFGSSALFNNTSGYHNTALGYNAASNLTTGSNNIVIGSNAQASSATAINEVTIGNSSNNYYRMYTSGWFNASDAKYKHDIESLPIGLDFVKQLRPVQYVYNHAANEEKSYGFIAQEVKAVVEANGLQNSDLIQQMDADHLGLKTTDLIPILTKAIQEQQAQIEKQQLLMEKQQQEIEELKKLMGKRRLKKSKKS